MWWLRGAVCGWSLMGTSGPRVSGHASAVVGEHLYVFGGLLGGSLTSDELWRYDGNQWNAIQNKGPTWPTRRMHAAMASAEGSLYIFGGWDPYAANEKIKRDVWEYNTHTKRWRELTSMPHTASQHAACVVEDRVARARRWACAGATHSWSRALRPPVVCMFASWPAHVRVRRDELHAAGDERGAPARHQDVDVDPPGECG